MTKDEKPTKKKLDNFYKDANNWKWGIFYFNKEDKRLFPPKAKWIIWLYNKFFKYKINSCKSWDSYVIPDSCSLLKI